jgi:hypothetical protein
MGHVTKAFQSARLWSECGLLLNHPVDTSVVVTHYNTHSLFFHNTYEVCCFKLNWVC